MKLATIQNKSGEAFNMRVVEKGDCYGHKMQLIHDKAEPMVEFYDILYRFERIGDTILGQFVSRYYLDTFKTIHGTGLNLQGGVPSWHLDRDAVKQAHSILEMWNL